MSTYGLHHEFDGYSIEELERYRQRLYDEIGQLRHDCIGLPDNEERGYIQICIDERYFTIYRILMEERTRAKIMVTR